MKGCLALLVLLLVVVGAALGWLYRGRLQRAFKSGPEPKVAAIAVHPDPVQLAAARKQLDALRRGKDSVVLSPTQAASWVGTLFGTVGGAMIDSLSVALGSGALEIRGAAVTSRLPSGVVGPLGVMLRDREPLRILGRVSNAGSGRGLLEILEMDVRGIPVPDDVMHKLAKALFGTSGAVEFELPAGATDVRVRPDGMTLYNTERR